MTIKPYEKNKYEEMLKMLITYLNDDLKCNWSTTFIEDKIWGLFVHKWTDGILFIDVVEENNRLIGFAIYQIDTSQSDWCKKEGWGFIREFYIQDEFRKQGYGYKLVKSIEQSLSKKKVKNIYLNADDALVFWSKCNYMNTNEVNKDGMYTLIKSIC